VCVEEIAGMFSELDQVAFRRIGRFIALTGRPQLQLRKESLKCGITGPCYEKKGMTDSGKELIHLETAEARFLSYA
jgi:hypothetical protein